MPLPFIAAAGLLAKGGASVLDSMGRRRTRKAQDAAIKEWLDFQERKKNEYQAIEDRERGLAIDQLNDYVDFYDRGNLDTVIGDESARLEGKFGETVDDIAANARMSGQAEGQNEIFDSAMAASLAKATAATRDRIKNMAKTTAYGGGSQYGMPMMGAMTLQDTSNELNRINSDRNSYLRELAQFQRREPEMFEYQQDGIIPLLDMAGDFALAGGFDFLKGSGGAPTSTPRPPARPTVGTSGGGGGSGFSFISPTGGANPFTAGTREFTFMTPSAMPPGFY